MIRRTRPVIGSLVAAGLIIGGGCTSSGDAGFWDAFAPLALADSAITFDSVEEQVRVADLTAVAIVIGATTGQPGVPVLDRDGQLEDVEGADEIPPSTLLTIRVEDVLHQSTRSPLAAGDEFVVEVAPASFTNRFPSREFVLFARLDGEVWRPAHPLHGVLVEEGGRIVAPLDVPREQVEMTSARSMEELRNEIERSKPRPKGSGG